MLSLINRLTHKRGRGTRNRSQFTEEPCNGKPLCTVLKERRWGGDTSADSIRAIAPFNLALRLEPNNAARYSRGEARSDVGDLPPAIAATSLINFCHWIDGFTPAVFLK